MAHALAVGKCANLSSSAAAVCVLNNATQSANTAAKNATKNGLFSLRNAVCKNAKVGLFGCTHFTSGMNVQRRFQSQNSAPKTNGCFKPNSPIVSNAMDMLYDEIEQQLGPKLAQLNRIKQDLKEANLGRISPAMVTGGMRGMTSMITETSTLDATNGITYRGFTLKELLESALPKLKETDKYPPVEACIWLLLTGNIPTLKQVETLRQALFELMVVHGKCQNGNKCDSFAKEKSPEFFMKMPFSVLSTIEQLPKGVHHPMSLLVMGSSLLSDYSYFKHAYANKMLTKANLWKAAAYDALSLIAKSSVLAAHIYRNTYHDGLVQEPLRELDLAGNFSRMLGKETAVHTELMRLYLILHADHEGGNVSAHTAHVVGSAHADVFTSYAAGMAGLSGPLHGLANQECLRWLRWAYSQLDGQPATKAQVEEIAKKTLKSGQVIPGFGHAVLRVTDPRFTAQREFALEYMAEDPFFKFLQVVCDVVPEMLLQTGKVKNPYPNVDCHSGLLLQHFKFTEESFYTVFFGVSRSIGISAQYVWSRALGMPIERPKSISLEALESICRESKKL